MIHGNKKRTCCFPLEPQSRTIMCLSYRKFKIQFNNTGHDDFIDFLKGFAILCVILTHSISGTFQKYILFPFWGAQAVPIFIIIQSYHFFKSEKPDILQWKFKKILKRIFMPFFIVTFAEILLLLSFGQSPVTIYKETITSGGIGLGCYFPWIYLQISIALPVFFLIFKHLNGDGIRSLSVFSYQCCLNLFQFACIFPRSFTGCLHLDMYF